MMTRRTFLGVAATVTAAGGLGLGGTLMQRRRLALAELAAAKGLPSPGTAVVLRGPDGLKLRAVVASVRTAVHPARPGATGTEQTSLLLKVEDREAPGGTYRLESDEVCLDELYFSPVNRPGRDRRLEAVITRIA